MRKFASVFKLLGGLIGLFLAAALIQPAPRLLAQQSSHQKEMTQPSQEQEQQGQKEQTFVGRISKSGGGEYVLKNGYASQDPSSKADYKLDDQDKAKQYAGKNVKVTGTLDASTNMIHVENIEEGS